MVGNRSSACADDYTYEGISIGSIGIPLGILVLFQNILSITTIWRHPKLHTNTNICIVSVALGDVILSTAYIANGIIHSPGVSHRFIDVHNVESFLFGVSYSSILLSINQMGIIAVDRYIYIAHPFYYITHVTKKRVIATIICFWCVACAYGVTPLIVYREFSFEDKCILRNPPAEYIWPLVVVYCLNVIVILIFYFKIAILAFLRKKAANARRLPIHDLEVRNSLQTNSTAAMKSVKFFALTCGIYITCTLPSGLCVIINVDDAIPIYLYVIVMYVYLLHPLVNFAIFVHMNKDFSEALKKTFTDVKQCCFKVRNV